MLVQWFSKSSVTIVVKRLREFRLGVHHHWAPVRNRFFDDFTAHDEELGTLGAS